MKKTAKCCILAFLAAVMAVTLTACFGGGGGGNTYEEISIDSAEALEGIRDNLAGAYKLTADINLSDYTNWTPIGTSSEPFTGSLDGNGKTVSNLKISSLSVDGLGLFGVMGSNSLVHSLKVTTDSDTGVTGSTAGIIAGKCAGVIRDCEVRGKVGKAGADNIGGIVGKQSGGNLKNNTNRAEVVGANHVGGIAGWLTTSTGYDRVIKNCINYGTVTASGNNAGGIAGYATVGSKSMSISFESCVNEADVTGKDYTGGILGYGEENIAEIISCENKGDITGHNFTGGYVGRGNRTAVTNCDNAAAVTGRAYTGGIAGLAGDIKSCNNSGTVTADGMLTESSINRACYGGIAGACTSVDNAENTGTLDFSGNGECAGGIAGMVGLLSGMTAGQAVGDITNCVNESDVTHSGANVGGIVGEVRFGSKSCKVDTNVNRGAVSGGANTGGIAGFAQGMGLTDGDFTSAFSACENFGAVTGSGTHVGGIAGDATGSKTGSVAAVYHRISFLNCENNAAVTGSNFVGGILGYRGDYINNQNGCANTGTVTALDGGNEYDLMM